MLGDRGLEEAVCLGLHTALPASVGPSLSLVSSPVQRPSKLMVRMK